MSKCEGMYLTSASFQQLAAGLLPLNKAYLRTARKYVSYSDAQDVVQEAFIAEWMRNSVYTDLQHVKKVFHTAVKNAALHWIQYTKAKKRRAPEVQNIAGCYTGIEEVEAANLLTSFACSLRGKPVLLELLAKLTLEEGLMLTPSERVNRIRLKKLYSKEVRIGEK